jgi:hypothetical protein
MENKLILENSQKLRVNANALTPGFKLELAPLLSSGIAFVKLVLNDATGKAIADNFYWVGADSASYRQLNKLPLASLSASATATPDRDEVRINVQIENRGASAALANKLTLENAADGTRILPAYLSDNYFSLLPGETRTIEIQYPAKAARWPARLEIRGWNLSTIAIPISNR